MILTTAFLALLALRNDDGSRARAERPLQELVSSDDYPAEALRLGMEGRVYFRLQVDAAGQVESCKIVRSSSHDLLDRTTCELMRSRARFTPARDSSGKNVPDTVSNAIRWQIQQEPGLTFEPTSITTTVEMTAAGLRCDQSHGSVVAPQLHGDDCIAATGGIAAMVEAGGAGTSMTMLVDFVPEGTEGQDPSSVDRGTRLFDAEADLVIDQDGAIEDCHALRQEVFGPLDQRGSPPSLCNQQFTRGFRFEPSTTSAARRGRLRMSIYINRTMEI
jgi:TonB family protein